jgi:hypothetical protein
MRHRRCRVLIAVVLGVTGLASMPEVALAQSATLVAGTVRNERGAPVPGATVSLDGSSTSASSAEDGRYSLTVAATRRGPASLTVRAIGYRPQQAQVTLSGEPVTLDWTLTAQATQLTGIVVTALSLERDKTTIGTSQQSLASEELTRVQAPNIVSAMSGKVSGVTIHQTGNLGGSSRIVIRGQGSILGENQPLFIVDGIPVSNA